MRRGDVWWLEHPPDRRRPVCVLTRDEVIPALSHVIVVEATTRARDIPTEVKLDPEDGLPRACVLALDTVGSVRKALLTERITTLSPARMHQVCTALRIATGC